MTRIVVFGSINTDLVITSPYIPKSGETLKGNDFFISHGGKGANQAVAASMLGGVVQMIGCLGNDSFGREALIALKNYNVGTTYVKVLDDVPSSVAVIIKVDNDNRIILGGGANESLTVNQLKDYMSRHKVSDSIFITQLENKHEEIFEAIRLAKESNMLTIFNPAPARKLDDSIFKFVDILIINQTESEIITGIYPESIDDSRKVYNILSKFGLKGLIITLGKTGSIVFEKGKEEMIKGYSVEVVDTTGAGDAYIGALAYGMANGEDIFSAARLASVVGALCVTKQGAQKAMPTINEVNIFKEKINGKKTDNH